MGYNNYLSKFLFRPKKPTLSETDLFLNNGISKITGTQVSNTEIYREAFSLKTNSSKHCKNYERLEFLGDSILGSVISCYLFENYPDANEGYLTQMKAKIVNRKNLNRLGKELKLTDFIEITPTTCLSENICGNLFEAFVGAIYLDLGYDVCKKTILERLLPPSEIVKLEHKVMSYKGLLLEWSQKKKHILRYETVEEHLPDKTVVFRSTVLMNDEKLSNATESSKKKAEEKAAQRAFYMLNKKENILEKPKTFS